MTAASVRPQPRPLPRNRSRASPPPETTSVSAQAVRAEQSAAHPAEYLGAIGHRGVVVCAQPARRRDLLLPIHGGVCRTITWCSRWTAPRQHAECLVGDPVVELVTARGRLVDRPEGFSSPRAAEGARSARTSGRRARFELLLIPAEGASASRPRRGPGVQWRRTFLPCPPVVEETASRHAGGGYAPPVDQTGRGSHSALCQARP